jgi:cyclopropane fatty-acyl-phospholipid synthase-like methyltransferase
MDAAPIDIIEAGYDAMADRYLDHVAHTVGDPRMRFLDELQGRLSDGSVVVDLGCGAGVPCTQALAERHSVIGVDVSSAQLKLAAKYVPTAEFRKADFADLGLPSASLDAVTAFYSMIHIPRARHADLFQRIASWLRPGGYFLLTLSAKGETDGVQEDFIGVPMYFSGFGPRTNREMLRTAGFEIIVDEIVTMQEPDALSSFQWLLVRRA